MMQSDLKRNEDEICVRSVHGSNAGRGEGRDGGYTQEKCSIVSNKLGREDKSNNDSNTGKTTG